MASWPPLCEATWGEPSMPPSVSSWLSCGTGVMSVSIASKHGVYLRAVDASVKNRRVSSSGSWSEMSSAMGGGVDKGRKRNQQSAPPAMHECYNRANAAPSNAKLVIEYKELTRVAVTVPGTNRDGYGCSFVQCGSAFTRDAAQWRRASGCALPDPVSAVRSWFAGPAQGGPDFRGAGRETPQHQLSFWWHWCACGQPGSPAPA